MFSFIQNLLLIAIGIIGIGFLIGFHELGHFLFCKLFKIKTPSFSIGMGPKLISKKIGDTLFSLSAIPLGGYVEIAGLEEIGQGEQKEARRTDNLSFGQKSFYQKFLVLIGGILFNLAFAYIAFIALFWMGMPKIAFLYPESMPVIVKYVEADSAAAQAGLQPGDKIVEMMYPIVREETIDIEREEIKGLPSFIQRLKNLGNKRVTLFVKRDSQQQQIDTIIRDVQGEGRLGIGFETSTAIEFLQPVSFIDGIKQGIQATNETIKKTIEGFKMIFATRRVDAIGGPLAIISETIKGAKQGFRVFLVLLAIISANLALLNIIPLPVLDGGQLLFTTIESIIRRPLPEKVKMTIQMITWVLLLVLIFALTCMDIKRLFFR